MGFGSHAEGSSSVPRHFRIMLPTQFPPATNIARGREGPIEDRIDGAFRAAADQEDIGRIFKRPQSGGRSRCKSRACREHRTMADVLFLRHPAKEKSR